MIGLHLLTYTIEILGTLLTDYTDQFPQMIALPFNFYFLSPVLLNAYVKVLANANWRPRYVLFVPALLELIVLVVLFGFPAHVKESWLIDPYHEMWNKVYVIAAAVFTIFVYVSTLRFVRVKQRTIHSWRLNLNWIALACYSMLAILLAWVVLNFLPPDPDNNAFFFTNALLGLTNGAYIYFVSISGITQLEVEPDEEQKVSEPTIIDPATQKIFNRAVALITDRRLYRQADLTLAGLAEAVNVHPKLLSKAINQCTGENFYQFINRRRVEEAKRMLADPKYLYLSILGIAQEAGFNSKSTFNSVFKKYTGLTPSEYQEINRSTLNHKNVSNG